MTVYDMSESIRQTNAWLGATTKAYWRNPAFAMTMSPFPSLFGALGEVTERAFEKVSSKPSWGIDSVVSKDHDYPVTKKIEMELPFCNLIHFAADRGRKVTRRVLLVAPMSGHYATLCRKTVTSLLPNCDVYVTEWKNARDVPLSAGKFDVEDYTKHIVKFLDHLGENIHVVAVCQPVPLTLVATAMMADGNHKAQPRTLTLIGGPVDPEANPTEVTDFGNKVTMGQLENSVITPVGFAFAGVGRKVYPGAMQLASFMSMNLKAHAKSFADQVGAVARGEASDLDKHNKFYDEYLAVMDMPAEFYLSTVDRIFKNREVARNVFEIDGKVVDITKIKNTAVKIVEGGRDDISAPGQCLAALGLLPLLPDDMKEHYVAPDAGHYGIFSGSAWRNDIRPAVLNFIDKHNDGSEDENVVELKIASDSVAKDKEIAAKTKALETKEKALAAKEKALIVKEKSLVEKEKAAVAKEKAIFAKEKSAADKQVADIAAAEKKVAAEQKKADKLAADTAAAELKAATEKGAAEKQAETASVVAVVKPAKPARGSRNRYAAKKSKKA